MGRVRMQVMGFTWMFVLFLCCAVAYNKLTLSGAYHFLAGRNKTLRQCVCWSRSNVYNASALRI